MLRAIPIRAIVFAVLLVGQLSPAIGQVDQTANVNSQASIADLAEEQQWEKLTARLKQLSPSQAIRQLNDQAQPDGMTTVHWASFYGNDSAVKLLLDHNCDVDAATIYQVTPLSIACEYGHAKVVKDSAWPRS